MISRPFIFGLAVGLAVAFASLTASAQWTNQTITLRPGWNAVYLELQPEPAECDTLFSSMPAVESVWMWNRRFSPVEFVQEPEELRVGQPDWLTWVPQSAASATNVISLHILLGGRAYLVKLSDFALPVTWTITGKPVFRKIDWLANSLNFVGFTVDDVNAPTFQNFFSASPQHLLQPVYRLNGGLWERVVNPSSTRLKRGEAYWVRSSGPSTYSGPIGIELEQNSGLDYGRVLTEQTLRIENRSTNARTFTVRRKASLPAPNSTQAPRAGDVPLCYFKADITNNQVGWFPLPVTLTNTIPPGGEWAVRLEARRADMAPFTPAPASLAPLYQSLIEISDNAGSRALVPVTAQGLQRYASSGGAGFSPASEMPAPHPWAGLWVGSAVITNVSQPASGNPSLTRPTASGFQFRILVHVDDLGRASLLQKVILMFKQGTCKPDTNNPNIMVVDEPGHPVLVTDDRLIPNFTGSTLRDGEPVGRRVSSAAFSFKEPILMGMSTNGSFGVSNTDLSCYVPLDYDDELNPFKHRYHPDHNNLDERFDERPEKKEIEGRESFTVTRLVQMRFTSEDPDGLRLAGWGDNQIGGTYWETITGLHKNTIYVQGSFRLHHASRVGVLNDGL